MIERVRKRLRKPFFAFDAMDAITASGIAWLDEERQAELIARGGEHFGRIAVLPGIHAHIRRAGDAGMLDDDVRHLFIHADGAAHVVAAHIRDIAQLEQPLNGAVLSILPVQDGKNTVQMTDLIRSFVQDEQSVVGQRARGAFLLLPAVMLQGVDASLIQEPLAFLGDRDHRDRITLCADLPQQAGR